MLRRRARAEGRQPDDAMDEEARTTALNMGMDKIGREPSTSIDGIFCKKQCADAKESARPVPPFPFRWQDLLDTPEKIALLDNVHRATLGIRSRTAAHIATTASGAEEKQDAMEVAEGEL
jgi:hypothetical protein